MPFFAEDKVMDEVKIDCDCAVGSLVAELKEFQSKLSGEQELTVVAGGLSFRLEKLRHERNTVIYYGSTSDNVPVTLVQHYRQLNVLFFAARKREADKPPARIGFAVE